MSVSIVVFLHSAKLPTPSDWAEAIRTQGFDMQLDSDFDPRTKSGFLPCQYASTVAGFEYYFGEAADTEPGDAAMQRIGDRDAAVSLVTHSEMRGLVTSVIAASVLCSLSDGLLWDTEADELVPASGALGWAREMEAQLVREL